MQTIEQNIQILASQAGVSYDSAASFAKDIADLIKSRFEQHGVPATKENIAAAIQPAMDLRMRMLKHMLDNPEQTAKNVRQLIDPTH